MRKELLSRPPNNVEGEWSQRSNLYNIILKCSELLPGAPFVLFSAREKETKLKEVLEGSKEKAEVFFIIGPEGGFDQEEVEEAKRKGFIPVTLGRRILRAETTSLCLLSILQFERGDIG